MDVVPLINMMDCILKRMDFAHTKKGSWDGKVLPAIAPEGDEIVLPKGSSSLWMSTNVGYLLRGMGMKQVVMVGALTDQCVESAIRDACDDNFLVTQVAICI